MFELSKLFKDKKVDDKFIKKHDTNINIDTDRIDDSPIDANYKKVTIGSHKWMLIWRTYPELQQEMLEYKKHCYVFCPMREQRIAYVICENNQNKYWCKCEKTTTE